jgi:hypothetical protein
MFSAGHCMNDQEICFQWQSKETKDAWAPEQGTDSGHQAEIMNFNYLLQVRHIQARTLGKTTQGRNQQGASKQSIIDSTLNLVQSRLIASLHLLLPLKMP